MQLLSLRDHHGTRLRILLQQFGDGGFERIQFADALPASSKASPYHHAHHAAALAAT